MNEFRRSIEVEGDLSESERAQLQGAAQQVLLRLGLGTADAFAVLTLVGSLLGLADILLFCKVAEPPVVPSESPRLRADFGARGAAWRPRADAGRGGTDADGPGGLVDCSGSVSLMAAGGGADGGGGAAESGGSGAACRATASSRFSSCSSRLTSWTRSSSSRMRSSCLAWAALNDCAITARSC